MTVATPSSAYVFGNALSTTTISLLNQSVGQMECQLAGDEDLILWCWSADVSKEMVQ